MAGTIGRASCWTRSVGSGFSDVLVRSADTVLVVEAVRVVMLLLTGWLLWRRTGQ